VILAAVDLSRLQQATIDAWEVVLAVLVLIVAWILSRMTRRGIRGLTTHLKGLDDGMRDLAARIGAYTILFIGIGLALSVLGAPIQPVLAAAVIFGIVLALSLRGIADNFASGIVIQTRGTIHLNDEIAVLGYQGRVRELNGRAVVIETSDGAMVHLPNAKILSNPFANLSERGARRSRIEISMEPQHGSLPMSDVMRTVRSVPGVVPDPAPEAHLLLAEPHGVVSIISFWHGPDDRPEVVSSVVEAVSATLPTAKVTALPEIAPPATPTPAPA